MPQKIIQKTLSPKQIEAFYHDEFVEEQIRDFGELRNGDALNCVVDVGGGIGHFARILAGKTGLKTRVIDMDVVSIERCHESGVNAVQGDALAPPISGDESVACFNLILHHLVGKDELETRTLQIQALRAWKGSVRYVFVNEYIYESFISNVSSRLIYLITSNSRLSKMASVIAQLVPAFKANTFGIGVRFRAHSEWCKLFAEAGYKVSASRLGEDEPISLPLRALLIKNVRRDSFRLEAIN
jgi:hypothetical protein